jgi:alkane 1-monooxygenase
LGQYLEPLIRFAVPFCYVAAVPALHEIDSLAPTFLVAALPLVLLAAEALPGPRRVRSNSHGSSSNDTLARRMTVRLTVLAQVAVVAWGTAVSAGAAWPEIAILSLTIGLGSGVFGMVAAHETIHSRDRFENAFGLLMLTGMTYRHFRISHVFGHHLWAATARDPATARLGESAYRFLYRSIAGQLADAWRFERARLACRRPWRNRIWHDLALYGAIYSFAGAALGWRAAIFLAVQSFIAIAVLELFNYVAHYGLVRRILPHGRLEPLAEFHSWNAKGEIGNWLLLDMGHHSDHHRHAPATHEHLTPVERMPVLPGGYAGAILLALFPVLWRRHMDWRVEHWLTGSRNGSDQAPSRQGGRVARL